MFCCAAFSTAAQSDTSRRSTATIIFGKEANFNNDRYNLNHSFKWIYSDLLFGMVGLHYEQKIIKKWAIEVGAGLTTLNFVGNFIKQGPLEDNEDQVSPTFSPENDQIDEDYDFESRKAGKGIFYSISSRYYYNFNEKGLEGAYLAVKYLYRKYNDEAYGLSPEFASHGTIIFDKNQPRTEEFEKNSSLSFAWGKQKIYKQFTFDMTYGLGILFINGERRDIGYVPNNTIYERSAIVAINPRKTSRTLPYLDLSFKFGFGWH